MEVYDDYGSNDSDDSSPSDGPNDATEDQAKLLWIRRKIVQEGSVEAPSILIPDRSANLRVWIPESITVLPENCFKGCKIIRSLSFESPTQLIRIESSAFQESSLRSIEIPRNVEILGSACFRSCRRLSTVSFESNSRLIRIEASAFSFSSLQSIEIPRNVEILGSSCFLSSRSLLSVSFESNSRLIRIETQAFRESSLQSIEIPRSVEILGRFCFSYCYSLFSISFESNSRLIRIKSGAFYRSPVQLIELPGNVQFIAGSSFLCVDSACVSIKSGRNTFSIENDFLVDVVTHRLIHGFSSLSSIEICANIEILGKSCFSDSWSISSISFQPNSQLIRIESNAFSSSSLQSIEIPRSVEILEIQCFADCLQLTSLSFESDSRIKRIETEAFFRLSCSVIVPSTILFFAYDATEEPDQASIAECDSFPEYNRWQKVRKSGIEVDLKRIRRFGSGLPPLSDCLFDFSGFIEGSVLSESERISTQLYEECEGGPRILVKSITRSLRVDDGHRKRAIEYFMNLRHPCISAVIGVSLPSQLGVLRVIGTPFGDNSLSRVISASPLWWTPTAKAKAIVGLAFALHFVHGFGFVHGSLTTTNVFFNEDGVIQITDFGQKVLGDLASNDSAERSVGGFCGERWTPKVDIQAFTTILSEIVVGTASEEDFVSEIIQRGQSTGVGAIESFGGILEPLECRRFNIMEGVDTKDVCSFVHWIKSSEKLIE
jgi:hypothetical protein